MEPLIVSNDPNKSDGLITLSPADNQIQPTPGATLFINYQLAEEEFCSFREYDKGIKEFRARDETDLLFRTPDRIYVSFAGPGAIVEIMKLGKIKDSTYGLVKDVSVRNAPPFLVPLQDLALAHPIRSLVLTDGAIVNMEDCIKRPTPADESLFEDPYLPVSTIFVAFRLDNNGERTSVVGVRAGRWYGDAHIVPIDRIEKVDSELCKE
jgi:hypothetical protein